MTDTAARKRGRPRKAAPSPDTKPADLKKLLGLVRRTHGHAAADALTQIVEDAAKYQELTAHLDEAVRGLSVQKKSK